jgi:hypothetical protein
MARTFYCLYQLSLVFCAGTCNALGDDFPLFIDESLESLFILVVNIGLLCVAKSTGALFSRALSFSFSSRLSYRS